MTTVGESVSHLRENPFELAQEQLRKVARAFSIDDNLVNVLSKCKKAVTVAIPVTMDDIVTLQRVCVEAGGSFSMDVGTGSGGVLLRVIGVDATVSYVSVRCTQP